MLQSAIERSTRLAPKGLARTPARMLACVAAFACLAVGLPPLAAQQATVQRDATPRIRTSEEIIRELALEQLFPKPDSLPAVRSVAPTTPGLGKSLAGGLLAGAAAYGIASGGLCRQNAVITDPNGGYVGGVWYGSGSHTIGTSVPCAAGVAGGATIGASLLLHLVRRSKYTRARGKYADSLVVQRTRQRAAYESAMRTRDEQISLEVARVQREDRQRVVTANTTTPQAATIGAPVSVASPRSGSPRVSGTGLVIPPVLTLAYVSFLDTDLDSALSANERGTLRVRVRNEGKGPARDVLITGSTDAAVRVSVAAPGELAPGESREFDLELVASAVASDALAAITLKATEALGFDADSIILKINTLAFRPPELTIAETVGVEDPQGRAVLTKGMNTRITVRVQNVGTGAADGVVVSIAKGDSTTLFTDDATTSVITQKVGRLRPGEYRDVPLQILANNRATGVALRTSAFDATGAYATDRVLALKLDVTNRRIGETVIASTGAPAGAVRSAAAPALGDDLLAKVPTAKTKRAGALAVIIGNRNYSAAPDVEFAANDAAVTRRYVEQALGFLPGNVFYLEDATLTGLKLWFGDKGNPNGKLKDLVIPGKTEVFVYYSGHGAPDPSERRAYLMPVDGDASHLALTGYSVDLLYENLAKLQASHVTVVLDACFSGAAGDGKMLIPSASPIGIQVKDPVMQFGEGRATIVTAADGQQLASWYPEKRHGLLTYFFLRALQGEADTNADNAISSQELSKYLESPDEGRLVYEARRLFGRVQTPQVWGAPGRLIR